MLLVAMNNDTDNF